MDDLHRYAIDEQGKTIYIKDVTQEMRHNKFYCKNCGGEMIPVLGKVRENHFRHKVVTPSCSYESYIHKIGKEKLKERFYTQETFLASYYIEYTCTKTNTCKFKDKLANLKCNKREKRTIDLKQLYNTCEEERSYKGFRADLMLSHSEHPKREPLFIEIAFTHDCTDVKLNSGIQIIEVKVKDDQDFDMPFEEQNVMFMDFAETNPYMFNDAPPVRFFNFPRKEKFSIPLSRFVVFKNKKGQIEGLDLPQKTNCQDFEFEHIPIVDYELVTSDVIVKQELRNNLYAFGLAMAIKKGYPVKHCGLCQRHHRGYGGCIFNATQEYEDRKTGTKMKRIVPVWTCMLSNEQINRAALALTCRDFIPNRNLVQRMLKMFEQVPFWDWENNDKKDM